MHEILKRLPDGIALLDKTATITETNQSWEETLPGSIGMNFIQVYEQKSSQPETRNTRLAIQKILTGSKYEYSCSFSTREQQFSMQVTPILLENVLKVMVSLRDISTIKANRNQDDSQLKVDQLTETNIALNALLKNREQDRANQEAAIVTNVKQLIMPYMERLAQAPLEPQEQTLVTIIKEYLDNIVSPFLHHISALNQQLTPQELKVATLIRQGRSSKEIGIALKLSVNGVGFHRKSLRAKLGLTGSGKNLRSQLMALR